MRVLSVDPGLSITGFSVLDQIKMKTKLFAYGAIRPPKNIPLGVRLNHLFQEIKDVLERFNPEVLAIEDAFYSKNVKSTMSLGQARGVIILAAAQTSISVYEFAPRKVKQSVCGNGAATKEQVQFMVMQILNLKEPPKPLDVSDSMAVGICYLNQFKLQ